MQKTEIEWCDYTWNPIKGICPVGCWYCYARKMYKRFRWMEHEIDLHDAILYEFEKYNPVKKAHPGSKIFICSTFELFHEIADKWRNRIFGIINKNPQLTFIILTKLPQNIDRAMPKNAWLGVSATTADDLGRVNELMRHEANIHFVSLEPILGYIPFETIYPGIDWAILGRLTGYGRRCDPPRHRLSLLIRQCECASVPIFMKNNLKEIWGEPLIQEFPK